MKVERTVVIMRSLTEGERRPWSEFKKRGGPLVEFLTELDMDSIEIRLGAAMAPKGITPSPGSQHFVSKRNLKRGEGAR